MDSNNTVIVYSAPWCAFCHAAKRYFDDKKVAYKDINVEEDEAARRHIVEKTGQAGIPVIEIGDQTIIGFDRPKIDAALNANQLA